MSASPSSPPPPSSRSPSGSAAPAVRLSQYCRRRRRRTPPRKHRSSSSSSPTPDMCRHHMHEHLRCVRIMGFMSLGLARTEAGLVRVSLPHLLLISRSIDAKDAPGRIVFKMGFSPWRRRHSSSQFATVTGIVGGPFSKWGSRPVVVVGRSVGRRRRDQATVVVAPPFECPLRETLRASLKKECCHAWRTRKLPQVLYIQSCSEAGRASFRAAA